MPVSGVSSKAGFGRLQLMQLLLFTCFLISQFQLIANISSKRYPLPQPVEASDLRVLTVGEAAVAAKMLGFWLLSYDTRAGQIIPFEDLNYEYLAGWLTTISELDPLSDYSSMVAAGVFIDVKDKQRKLRMIKLVRQRFLDDPEVHWRWMAQAVMLSKYRLHDLPLALSLAKNLREASAGTDIPFWAREMQAYLLHDMGELEAALLLFKAMIEEGSITDPDEVRFLESRILELEATIDQKQGKLSDTQQH